MGSELITWHNRLFDQFSEAGHAGWQFSIYLPEDHKIILVPADPTYSPFEEELWPLINGTIHQTLQPHPDVFAKVVAAVDRALEAHRGWRNPYPASLDTPLPPTRKNN